jgi:hypothetical protein
MAGGDMISKQLVVPVLLLGLVFPASARAQSFPPTDTTIVFTPAQPHMLDSDEAAILTNSWGIDLMLSNNGFGAGTFYRKRETADLSWFGSLAVSDVKDEQEVEYYDIYGRSFSPYKKNRLMLIPLFGGIQYRLFRDEIADNFRPYVAAAVGPAMMLVAPYQKTIMTDMGNGQSIIEYQQIEFFESLKYATVQYTVGGYIGAGAYFGSESGTLSGISIRYYFIPFQEGIETLEGVFVNNFGGLYITLNFGSFF